MSRVAVNKCGNIWGNAGSMNFYDRTSIDDAAPQKRYLRTYYYFYIILLYPIPYYYIVIRLGLGKLLVNLLQVVKRTNTPLIP